MAMKVSTGVSKKIGQPDYGSLGASCTVEFEVDSGLLQTDLEKFHQQVRNAYVACGQAVKDELARQAANTAAPNSQQSSPNGNGRPPQNGNGQPPARPATASQVRALLAIAGRNKIDLPLLLCERFGVGRAEDLSIADASRLIDELKQPTSNGGGRR